VARGNREGAKKKLVGETRAAELKRPGTGVERRDLLAVDEVPAS
jgi:hypothetical protein